jgi:simple sugar transport system ATP-binding protein
LIISQDLDEIFEICDRIAVLYQGTLSPSITRESTSVHQIGLLMGGKTGE